jgi:hypothetical protein
MQMKNKYFKTLALSAFSLFAGLTATRAQDTPFLQFGGKPAQDTAVTKKLTVWEYLTKTPWIIQVGPDVVDDNDTRLKEFSIRDDRNYFPIHCSIEKRIKNKWGIQYTLSSETLHPHNFGSNDINIKYSLNTKSIRDKKWFDPYAMIGGGHTYRDFPHGQHNRHNGKDNSLNANVGGGVNLWIFDNFGLYAQTLAKFDMFQKKWGGSNYIQFSVGFAWKIGSDIAKVETPVVVPSNYKRSKEAEDAAEYLRQILNK